MWARIALAILLGLAPQSIPFPGPGMPAASGSVTPAIVQNLNCFNVTATTSCTITALPTAAGNLLVGICASYGNHGQSICNAADGTSTYSTACDFSGAFGRYTVQYAPNSASGLTTFTFTTTAGGFKSAKLLEVSGIATSSPLDLCAATNNPQTGVTSWASNSITTTVPDFLLGVSMSVTSGNISYASTGAFTTLAAFPNTTDGDDAYAQYQAKVNAGSYAAAGSCTTANTNTLIVGFKSQ